jgi:hypothetical protein
VKDPKALPKFESRKNPFQDATRTNCNETPGKAPFNSTKKPSKLASSSIPTPFLDGTAASGVRLAPKTNSSGWRAKLSAVTGRLWRGRFVKRAELAAHGPGMKGRFFGQGGKTTPKPPFRAPMVQSELSLEGVRVVRNDLSDSDLEIIAAKNPAGAPSAAKTNAAAEKPARAAAVTNQLNMVNVSQL